jgi:transposase
MFSYISPEARVPKDHPLRPIRAMVDRALDDLAPLFREMYSYTGRPSIPPEQLLRASLLQVLYSIRSERMLVEQLDYNLLFRWFVGLSMDDKVWNHSTFSKNRERLMLFDVATAFFQATMGLAERAGLISKDHFTVDGTLIEA